MYYIKALMELLGGIIAVILIAPVMAVIVLACELLDVILKFHFKIFHRKEYEESLKDFPISSW